MKPSTPADCLSHVRSKLSDAEYEIALARIEQLVAAERAIGQEEMDEVHRGKGGALFFDPFTRA